MRFSCLTTKAANTHSEYVILIAFLLQRGCVYAPQRHVWTYIARLVYSLIVNTRHCQKQRHCAVLPFTSTWRVSVSWRISYLYNYIIFSSLGLKSLCASDRVCSQPKEITAWPCNFPLTSQSLPFERPLLIQLPISFLQSRESRMKFHTEFHLIRLLSFAHSHSLISPLNTDLNCIFILQVLRFAYAPANCVSKHGKQPRSKKDVTSTLEGVTLLHIHKFSPIICLCTVWFLMNLHIYKISPIISICTGWFLMNLHIYKFSHIICMYTGWFLMNLCFYKISPIICIYTGRFLMNLYIYKFSPIICIYTGWFLTNLHIYKIFSYYTHI